MTASGSISSLLSNDYSCKDSGCSSIVRQLSVDGDSSLTYWSWLQSQPSSIYDLIDNDDLLDTRLLDSAFVHEKPKLPNPRPYVAFKDLNNSDDAKYENPPKAAIEIGLKFEV